MGMKKLFQGKMTSQYHNTNAVYLRIKNEAQTMHYTVTLNIALSNHRLLLLASSDCSLWTIVGTVKAQQHHTGVSLCIMSLITLIYNKKI